MTDWGLTLAQTRLSDASKSFIVQSLARFETPSEVQAAIKKEFGVAISRQAVEAYDPTKFAGASLNQRWRDLFAETRRDFQANRLRVGVANQVVRLRVLHDVIVKSMERGDYDKALKGLEQAAKEVGRFYDRAR